MGQIRKELMGQIPLEREFRGAGALWSVLGRLLHAAARYLPMFPGWRARIHRFRGVRVGKGVFIGSDVFIDNTYPDRIVIEDFVTILSRSFILGHSFFPKHLATIFIDKDQEWTGVTLRKGSYIGAQSIIMPGVTIGECAVIGAGSLVTSDIPPYSIAVGSPARVIRFFPREEVAFG